MVPESTFKDDNNGSIWGHIAKKCRKLSQDIVKYMNTRLICRSIAKVERLWSLENHLLLSRRDASTLILAEAVLFLKLNITNLDLLMICQAIVARRDVEHE